MKFLFFTLFLVIISFSISHTQVPIVNKIEPPNWWKNHSYNKVQLMVYGEYLDSSNVKVNNEKIKIEKVTNAINGDYTFVDIILDKDIEAKSYNFTFSNKFGKVKYKYDILDRDSSINIHMGFNSNDVVYLIFPDRFINGDTSNDFLFNEKDEFEFESLNGRHGGDIQGIINSIDYLNDLGVTTIWSTPVLENNMYMSYHGYAATDFYKVDPRHGSNELYKVFVRKAHEKGIKVIYDHVSNHIGINHPWVNNPPTDSWFNGEVNNHLGPDHNKIGIIDIHGDPKTIKASTEGWFTDYMPDLNQTDPFVARYIIQNTIWWIEFSGIDGIREDTYPYSNQKFMAEWAETILEHYPNFNIVGEVWKGLPSVLAAYQADSYFPREFDTNLPVVTDFALRDALYEYLLGESDLSKIYETIAQDFIYSNPNNLLVFFDNHDIDRGMFGAKWDLHKYKSALTLVLTTRGIPQLLYGTEFGLDGGGHHGHIREMFPVNLINGEEAHFPIEKKIKQNNIYNFTRKLLQLRKQFEVLRAGKLIHFPPKDNVYIYTKELNNNMIMICINDNFSEINVNLENYLVDINKIKTVKNLLKSEFITINHNREITIPSKSISIYLID